MDLMDDDVSDKIRLQVPVCIGMRYGTIPVGMANARTVPAHRISISADVRMQGVVKSVTSPTHPTVTVNATGVAQASSVPQTAAYYNSKDFLEKDFVLSIAAEGLDAPRCFAQRAKDGTTAIQLNIVPKFNLPSVSSQEYIFLVDRSGSMDGSRIDTAKRTLVMLLRALPSQGTHFNIFSFGTHCNSLWAGSVQYSEETLEAAVSIYKLCDGSTSIDTGQTRHIDTMWADYGGTEMQNALETVFRSRRMDTPTACFVLTDGEVSEHPLFCILLLYLSWY